MNKIINITVISIFFSSFCAGQIFAADTVDQQKKQMLELCEKKKEEMKKNNMDPSLRKDFETICNATTISDGDPQQMSILGVFLSSAPKSQTQK